MRITSSSEQDVEKLSQWIEADPYHKDCFDPTWWLTGSGILSFCLQDDIGPVAYVRLDEKDVDGLIRLHTQFAPIEEVSKLRLAKSMIWCVPVVQKFCKQNGGKGVIFQSVNSLLIEFMKKKFNFEEFGQDNFVWKAV